MAATITEMNRQGTPIAVLRDKRDVMSSEDDLRLDDYLNDKLQSVDDLQDLDSLIAGVEKQRSQLQGQVRCPSSNYTTSHMVHLLTTYQLQDAQSKLIASREAASQHTEALLAQTSEFRAKQAGIDRRLAIVTASDAPDEAVQKFRGPIEKLRKLDLANYYVELLQQVDNLAEEVRTFLPGRPKEALKPYAQLKDLALRLRQLQAPAEEAAGHLVNYVERRAEALWEEMERIMLDDFDSILKKSDWPTSSQGVGQEWTESFSKLLELQTPEIMNSNDVVVLLPMTALAKVFIQQFRYHFMGSKATNSKLHPDYFLEWIITLVEQREAFLIDNVQPILVSHFGDTKLATIGVYVDPVAAFITALLPVLREKTSLLLPDIQREPAALSNFMVSLMRFDEDIRSKFNYDGGWPREGWRGLTWEVLDVWFSGWLTVEQEFAISRYRDIIMAKDSFKIDYDSTGPKRTKYTYGAPKVTDLIGTITTQYQSLKKFEFKLRFLIDIQLAILDEYHGLLKDSLDAYMAMTSTVGRALHGVTKEQMVEVAGTKGLESLCKVYGSSDHVINTLHDWSNELFFVDLWNELQVRAKRSGSDDNLAERMSYDEVRSSTSAAVGSGGDGGLFDETIASFKRRRDHAERLMTESIKYALGQALRGYVQRPNWLVVDNNDTGTSFRPFLPIFNPPLLNYD